MRRVKRVEVNVSSNAPGAADTRDYRYLLQVHLGIDQRACEAVNRRTDTASGTPDVRHAFAAQERLDRVLWVDIDCRCCHRATSRIVFRMSSGLCTVPP